MSLLIVENPLMFLFLYFLRTISVHHIPSLLSLALLTTSLSYPLIYLGRITYEKILVDQEKWKRELVTSIVVSFVFWFLLRLWYLLAGSVFTTSIVGLLIWIVISGTLFYLIYLLGVKVHGKIVERWTMPLPISILVSNYIVNLIAWIVLYVLMLINLSSHYAVIAVII